MSRYVVRIVGPAGYATYLARGRETGLEQATRYPHPSNAWQAGWDYREKNKGLFTFDVIDTRDPGRRVPA